jgi:hypothetical protein
MKLEEDERKSIEAVNELRNNRERLQVGRRWGFCTAAQLHSCTAAQLHSCTAAGCSQAKPAHQRPPSDPWRLPLLACLCRRAALRC